METTGPSVISMIWCWIFANSATIRDVGSIPLALIGIGLLTWRVCNRGASRARASEEQIALARQASLDGRYQKAADMLGSDLLSVRLGGIYGLTQLARGYPKEFHLQVIDLLATFVRHPPPIPEGGHSRTSNPREEVQTILEFFLSDVLPRAENWRKPSVIPLTSRDPILVEPIFYPDLILKGST